MKKLLLMLIISFLFPLSAFSQEVYTDLQGVVRAEVINVLSEEIQSVPGTALDTLVQMLDVRILEGEKEGKVVRIQNDFIRLKKGEKFFLNYLITIDGQEIYTVRDPDRRGALLFFIGIFIFLFILFTGWKGFRSLLALGVSFLLIIYFLLPNLLSGASPILICVIFSMLVLALVMYLTHGFNWYTHAAFLGTTVSVFATAIIGYIAVYATKLTGFISDEVIYLNLDTGGTLNLSGLLLGSIIVGTIGVLDDIAITQAASVGELHSVKEDIQRKELFLRALRIGKEHLGALVNTLALAYAGAALPLLLLFSMSQESMWILINREVFSAEIVRTVVGSIGLTLTVPITTLLATYFVERFKHSKVHIHTH